MEILGGLFLNKITSLSNLMSPIAYLEQPELKLNAFQ